MSKFSCNIVLEGWLNLHPKHLLLTIFRDARRHLHLAVMDNYELTSFSVRTGEILFSRRFFFSGENFCCADLNLKTIIGKWRGKLIKDHKNDVLMKDIGLTKLLELIRTFISNYLTFYGNWSFNIMVCVCEANYFFKIQNRA